MEQLTIQLNNMEDVKKEIDACQRRAMTNVVELGYILRKADDAQLFKELGYQNIFEFGEQEYGWSKDQTSRFMNINRQFSEGGYSTVLKEEYQGYGRAKLTEILTIPEEIRSELSPEMKRDELRQIGKEKKAADEVNREDQFRAAVMMEESDSDYLKDSVNDLISLEVIANQTLPVLWPLLQDMENNVDIRDKVVYEKLMSSKIPSFIRVGKYMYFLKPDYFTVIKGSEKKKYTYQDLLTAIIGLRTTTGQNLEDWYLKITGKSLPKEDKKQPERKEPKIKESKIKKTKPKKPEKQEPKVKVAPAQQEDTIDTITQSCPYCSGEKEICSNDEKFRIRIQPTGIGRIERGIYNAVMEFNYCPTCGKELREETEYDV